MKSNDKVSPDEKRIRELEAQLKAKDAEIAEKDEVILEMDAHMQNTAEEAKNKFPIASLDGQKYELRFLVMRMRMKKGVWRRVTAQEVKENPALLEKLVRQQCTLVVPYCSEKAADKNTSDNQLSKIRGGEV